MVAPLIALGLGFTVAAASLAVLRSVGFAAVGIVGGSLAAAWQSSMGSVAAGSTFSFLQSLAMGGLGALAPLGIVAGAVSLLAFLL
mmetsp:Transcript_59807/g.159112  ORF Transcript_59807/g.159112 Transcript_59807/m.159112 type:complete len:86 (-) Transcript_59807:265-522(-)|eukprot:CAMPEP_0113661678 /NCGR_PEP_ID=MMETSP0038_2-20120614/111_1 /TAXON_ID=2898 /ORGANISM="Cryptomonas paramecium" /LENGTH=85 /DNA_ID=CAMNT_0000576403 /DNA_START=61 /DNA_END=318 /DNA_ORIENTATION=- /assembly_acc=CAM_ASM_000170